MIIMDNLFVFSSFWCLPSFSCSFSSTATCKSGSLCRKGWSLTYGRTEIDTYIQNANLSHRRGRLHLHCGHVLFLPSIHPSVKGRLHERFCIRIGVEFRVRFSAQGMVCNLILNWFSLTFVDKHAAVIGVTGDNLNSKPFGMQIVHGIVRRFIRRIRHI
jgi:hypothetical protein